MSAIPVQGAPEGFDALLLARRRAEFAGPVIHVARDDARMARLAEALEFFAPEVELLRFPAWDCLPYDRVSPNPALVSERIATLARLLERGERPRVVLTTVNALVQRVPPRSAFEGASLPLRVNGTVRPEELARFLGAHGYVRADTVMEPGEFAMRGGIVDIFPAGEPDPVRLDLFGDTVESIRSFDPGTQRSADRRERLTLRPVSEVPLDRDSIARFRTAWRELFGQDAAKDPLYLSISDGRRHPGMEHWVPLFQPRMETLLDYLPGASVSLDHQAEAALEARLEMIADHQAARRSVPREGEVPYRPLPPDRLYLDRPGWDAMLAGGPLFAFAPFGAAEAAGVDAGGRPGPVFAQIGLGAGGAAGPNAFDQLRAQAARWAGRGQAAGDRGLDPRLARADRPPAARARLQGGRRRGQLGGGAAQAGGGDLAGHPGRRARFPRRAHRPGQRAGPAGRADQPAAAAAQAGRPVHRRGDRDRRGRPRGAPGPRHRPL